MRNALTRANVPLSYSQGFNPRPLMNFALPLSVGAESICELLDICTSEIVKCEETMEKINLVLPDNLHIREIYIPERKLTEIKYAEYVLSLDYADKNVQADEILRTLFDKPAFVQKKTKSGEKNTDISPLVKKAESVVVEGRVRLKTINYAGNDNYLNPVYCVKALSEEVGREPEDIKILRTKIFDGKGKEFR